MGSDDFQVQFIIRAGSTFPWGPLGIAHAMPSNEATAPSTQELASQILQDMEHHTRAFALGVSHDLIQQIELCSSIQPWLYLVEKPLSNNGFTWAVLKMSSTLWCKLLVGHQDSNRVRCCHV